MKEHFNYKIYQKHKLHFSRHTLLSTPSKLAKVQQLGTISYFVCGFSGQSVVLFCNLFFFLGWRIMLRFNSLHLGWAHFRTVFQKPTGENKNKPNTQIRRGFLGFHRKPADIYINPHL